MTRHNRFLRADSNSQYSVRYATLRLAGTAVLCERAPKPHLRSAVESCTRMAVPSGSTVPNSASSPRGSRTARALYALQRRRSDSSNSLDAVVCSETNSMQQQCMLRKWSTGIPHALFSAVTSPTHNPHLPCTGTACHSASPDCPWRTCCGTSGVTCPARRWGSSCTACTPPGCGRPQCSQPQSAPCQTSQAHRCCQQQEQQRRRLHCRRQPQHCCRWVCRLAALLLGLPWLLLLG